MMRAMVYSVNDPAGAGIAEYVREVCSVEEYDVPRAVRAWRVKGLDSLLVGFEEDVIFFDFLDEILPESEYYIFLSRHSAESGIKSFTTHHTGNPTSQALYGGRPHELSIAIPPLSRAFLEGMAKVVDEKKVTGYKVVYEVTHHGPTNLRRPLSFIEIGSSIEEWRSREAHEVIGEVVIRALKGEFRPERCFPVVGFGGPHYAETFTRRALERGECYGHMIPRYALKELRERPDILKAIATQTLEKESIPIQGIVMLKKVGSVTKKVLKELAAERGLELITA